MFNKIFYIIFFIFILFIFRIIPHSPNFTPIIAFALVGPTLLKSRIYGLSIPIFSMFISDIVIGFHSYQLIIYLTLLSISLISPLTKSYFKHGLGALIASSWFFISTNFAVWIVWDFYPKTFDGLILCYTMAIPFFQNTIISTVLFTFIILLLKDYIQTFYKICFSYIEKIKV